MGTLENTNWGLVALAILIGVLIVYFIYKPKASKHASETFGNYNSNTSVREVHAKILSKRTAPYKYSTTVLINYILFETDEGQRIELAIKDSNVYGTLLENDEGILKYQDNHFIGFIR